MKNKQQFFYLQLFSSGTDFFVGALHYKPTSLLDVYTPTTPYYLSSFRFIVSSHTDPYDPFIKLLLPFRSEIWLILILMLVGGNVVVYFITQVDRQVKYLVLGRMHQRPVYNMVIVSLGGPVSRDPRVPFSRFLLMVWLLATFILRTIYQGLMYHFIRHDLHIAPPKTLQELQHSGYTVLMSEVVYNDIYDLKALRKNAVLFNGSELDYFDMLRHPEQYDFGKMAILTAHEYFGYYRMLNQDVSDFYVVPEMLFTQQLSIYMTKNSIFLNRFNMYIKNYINEGIMNKWERYVIYEHHKNNRGDERPKPMGLYQLYGALNLLTFCLGFCSCVFILELIIHRLWASIRRTRRSWR